MRKPKSWYDSAAIEILEAWVGIVWKFSVRYCTVQTQNPEYPSWLLGLNSRISEVIVATITTSLDCNRALLHRFAHRRGWVERRAHKGPGRRQSAAEVPNTQLLIDAENLLPNVLILQISWWGGRANWPVIVHINARPGCKRRKKPAFTQVTKRQRLPGDEIFGLYSWSAVVQNPKK